MMKNWRTSKLPVKENQYANVFSSFDYQMKSVGDAIAHGQTRRISTLSRRKERKKETGKREEKGENCSGDVCNINEDDSNDNDATVNEFKGITFIVSIIFRQQYAEGDKSKENHDRQ